jgi:hypothetical protein
MTEWDYDAIHDVVIDATGKSLNHKEIDELVSKLPSSIIHTASEWGFWDTVVGDKIYEWIKEEEGKI